ncbi:MAG: hypothetical protein K8F34_00170, partial [Candidatus Kuenenia stuttgartiensis]|nr:hypothetical protein [Candidatus Kuenenia stuttgartiensis]
FVLCLVILLIRGIYPHNISHFFHKRLFVIDDNLCCRFLDRRYSKRQISNDGNHHCEENYQYPYMFSYDFKIIRKMNLTIKRFPTKCIVKFVILVQGFALLIKGTYSFLSVISFVTL